MSLQELSDKATSGPWSAADEHGDYPGATPAWCISRDDEATGKWLHDIAYLPQFYGKEQADADFIVELVNAFRSGRLVEETP